MNLSLKTRVIVTWCCVIASSSYAVDVQIPASRDNTLYQNPERSNGASPKMWTGRSTNGNLKRCAVFFDIASIIPAEATITSAVLSISVDRAPVTPGGATMVNIHRLSKDWGEGLSASGGFGGGGGTQALTNDMTFTHTFYPTGFWASAGGDFVAASSAGTSVTWPTIADFIPNHFWSSAQTVIDVQGWLDEPSSNFGWMVIGSLTMIASAKRFISRNSTNESEHPTLFVGFVTLTTTTSTTTLPLRFEDTGGAVVGYWPGDDTTADDQSLFNNDGTFAGDAGTTTNIPACLFANQTNSFAFDGTGDWISIGNSGFPGGPNPSISIAFWVNVQSRPDNPGDEEYFIGLGNSAVNNRRIMVGGRNEGDVSIEHGGGTADWVATSTLLPLNTWVHVTYTASNTVDRIYTNGTLSDVNDRGFILVNQVGFGRLGAAITNNPAGALEMDGYLDEPAVFNRTLTSAEAQMLFLGTTTSTTSTSSTLTSSTSSTSTSSTSTTTTSTTTSPFVNMMPYAEPFEAMPPYTNDFAIDGTNGWIGKDNAAFISTNAELNATLLTDLEAAGLPFAIPGDHTKVLCIAPDKVPVGRPREAMNISSKVNGNTDTVFTDFLWRPRMGVEPRTTDTNAQLAFCTFLNGAMVIYHDDSGTPEWHPLTNAPILNAGVWVRVTIEKNYMHSRWRLRINGQEHISDPKGWNTAGGSSHPGPWFDMVNKGSSMSKLQFEGEGYTDDVVVQSSNPFSDAILLIIR